MAEFAGALSIREQRWLESHYFLRSEINDFNNAQTIDGKLQNLNFQAENFQSMIRDRVKFVQRLKALGYRKQKVVNIIRGYYTNKRSKRSAFDLLQVENSPGAAQRQQTDAAIARRLLKQARIRSTFGKGYISEGIESMVVPRNIPKPKTY